MADTAAEILNDMIGTLPEEAQERARAFHLSVMMLRTARVRPAGLAVQKIDPPITMEEIWSVAEYILSGDKRRQDSAKAQAWLQEKINRLVPGEPWETEGKREAPVDDRPTMEWKGEPKLVPAPAPELRRPRPIRDEPQA